MAILGKDVQGALERFRAALEEHDLIHPGDSIGIDDATLLCAGSLFKAFCRMFADGGCSLIWQTIPARTPVRRGQGTRDVVELPGMAQDRGRRRHRRAVQAARSARRLCTPLLMHLAGNTDCGNDGMRKQYSEQKAMHEYGWAMSWHKVRLPPFRALVSSTHICKINDSFVDGQGAHALRFRKPSPH